jgi:DNA-binding NarL/FixJ family response regulator
MSEKTILKFIVIDDHESVLNGTVEILRKNYPSAEFNSATNASYAFEQVISYQPDLVVMDLSIPEKPEMIARVDTGIQLLKVLMKILAMIPLPM